MSKPDKADESGKTRPNLPPVFDAEDTNVRHPPREGELSLPFERDEAPEKDEPDPNRQRQVIEQAARDIERGLRDTDRHGVPSDVPGPGVAPEDSPGADVPPEGVDVPDRSPRQRGQK